MRRMLGLLVAFFLVILCRELAPGSIPADADATLALGFVLIVSFILGQAASALGVPSITGYILAGVLFGPYVLTQIDPRLGVLTKNTVEDLRLLDGVALGLIALTAGGELRLSFLRERARSVTCVTLCHLVLVFLCVAGVMWVALPWFASFADLDPRPLLAAAMLIGITAVAKSPATTIAVIQESGARGRVTDLVLGVTVVKDVLVVAAFTMVVSSCGLLLDPNTTFDTSAVGMLLWEIFGSVICGVVLGTAMALYLKYIRRELPLMVLGVALLSAAVAEQIHVSGLLMCMVAGFCIENFADRGEELIHAIERHALIVYVIFFTIAGAALDIEALRATWVLALFTCAVRLLFTYLATYAGARIAGDDRNVRRLAWTGFLGQAGVTLGFAGIITTRFTDIGPAIGTVIVAGIALNQIIGPVIFRIGLRLAGETRETRQTTEEIQAPIERREDSAADG